MTHPHFEFVADASDDFDALQAFSRQFDNEDEMHEYILDQHLRGLSYRTTEGVVERPFIEMPKEAWDTLFRQRRPRPGR
jgi:hypothetical protein